VVNENPLLNPTMAELFDEWLEHMQSRVGIRDEKRRYSQGTIHSYRHALRSYLVPFLGHRRVGTITTADLRRLITHLQSKQPHRRALAPGTTTTALRILSGAMTFAVKSGYIERNVCLDLPREDRPSAKRATEPRYLTADEIAVLLDSAERLALFEWTAARHRALVACMAYAALRCSEVLGLTWQTLDFKADEISIIGQLSHDATKLVPTKTRASTATVVMAPALKRDLLTWRSIQAQRNLMLVRPDAFVFVKESGKPLPQRDIYRTVRSASDRAGLNPPGLPPVSPHDLRHTAIALAIQSGAPITEVCEFARHSNPDITLRIYAGLAKDARGGAMRRLLDAGYGV
jgi:integrase